MRSDPMKDVRRYNFDWHAGPSGRERKVIVPIEDAGGAYVTFADFRATVEGLWEERDALRKERDAYKFGGIETSAALRRELDDAESRATRAEAALKDAGAWRPIAEAPRDGAEIIVYREDAGVFMASWYALRDRMTDRDIEREIEDAEARGDSCDWLDQEDWFCEQGGRLEGNEAPTHWMPKPEPPK